MTFKRIFACFLTLAIVFCSIGAVSASAIAACEVESVIAVYNTQTETITCTVNYTGAFLTNQNYVFLLNNGNGAQLTMRTVRGSNLSSTDSSFTYSFSVAQNVVNSAPKPLTVTVRGTNATVISPYTEDLVIISGNPTVRFEDWDGTLLKSQTVDYGTAATSPDAPVREGFTFVCWDTDFDCVTSDITITAVYVENVIEESSEELPPAEDSSEVPAPPVVSACEITSMSVVYNTALDTLTYTAEYTGTLLTQQVYIFMLYDGEGNLIGAPSVRGSELVVRDNSFSYSSYLAGDVVDGHALPLTGMVRSTSATVINAFSAEVTYTDDMLLGDVNFDGNVDNLDAAYVLRYDALLIQLDRTQLVVGDVNRDGFTDSLDAAAILKHDVGLIVIQ